MGLRQFGAGHERSMLRPYKEAGNAGDAGATR
jgi:hypothetical protein